jgi:glutaredoxin
VGLDDQGAEGQVHRLAPRQCPHCKTDERADQAELWADEEEDCDARGIRAPASDEKQKIL